MFFQQQEANFYRSSSLQNNTLGSFSSSSLCLSVTLIVPFWHLHVIVFCRSIIIRHKAAPPERCTIIRSSTGSPSLVLQIEFYIYISHVKKAIRPISVAYSFLRCEKYSQSPFGVVILIFEFAVFLYFVQFFWMISDSLRLISAL